MKRKVNNFIKKYFVNNVFFTIFGLLFLALIVTRFYEVEVRSGFNYDQVDNAWAAKNIIDDGKLPLVGMQAKGNTGFFIGPYYYYFLVPFYFLTNLDPSASAMAAGFVSIITFLVIYFVTREIFDEKVALFAVFIDVFSSYIIGLDRTQWPVNFIVPISFLIFYSLFKISQGKQKYFFLLAGVLGFSLHIHFTSIFYFVYVFLALPFIPRNKRTLKYFLYSIPVFLLFLFPLIVAYQTQIGGKAVGYLGSTFHGFHLRRLIQIVGDGFIEFNAILSIPYALFPSIISFMLFIFLTFRSKIKTRFTVLYLSLVWIFIPWIAFSTYSGELTNYYFGVGRPIAIIAFSYLLARLFGNRSIYLKMVVIVVVVVYSVFNILNFLKDSPVGLETHRRSVKEKISKGETIEFVQGDPQSFLYYIYKERNNH